jgi:hypothetical protein
MFFSPNSKDKIQKFDLVTILKSSYSKFRQKNPLKKVGYAPTLTASIRNCLILASRNFNFHEKALHSPIELSPLASATIPCLQTVSAGAAKR